MVLFLTNLVSLSTLMRFLTQKIENCKYVIKNKIHHDRVPTTIFKMQFILIYFQKHAPLQNYNGAVGATKEPKVLFYS
jgi:hypothetical protein